MLGWPRVFGLWLLVILKSDGDGPNRLNRVPEFISRSASLCVRVCEHKVSVYFM